MPRSHDRRFHVSSPAQVASGAKSLLLVAALLLSLPGRAGALIISEVMYHSDEVDDRPFEFIELYNEDPDPLDMGGFTICNGVSFEFPLGTWIEGHSFLVVCANEANIQAKYSMTNTVGDWFTDPATSPSLDNGGERIEVCNAGGTTIATVRYNDRGKWPSGADGTGHSLEIKSPYVEIDDPDSWVLSNDIGGSPGLRNPCWPEGTATVPSTGPVGIFTDHGDVGLPCVPGATTESAGRYSVSGGGIDIWTGGDQFQFAHVRLQGNFDMKARMPAKMWAPGSRWGKVGIMARQDLTSTSRYTMIQEHGEDTVDAARLATRPTHGGADNVEEGVGTGAAHPTWVRLSRTGNVFRGYTSTNGTSWTQVGPDKDWGTSAPAIVYLGLAVCSHADCAVTTIDFDNVTITGTILPPEDPGEDPPEPGVCVPRVPVRINEGFLYTGGPEAWIELYNSGGASVDLSGYHLTDDPADLTKYEIPAGTTIESKGYRVFTESQLGLSLAVGAAGQRKFIALTESGATPRVIDAFNFEPLYAGYSEAQVPGDDKLFSPAADPTPGAENVASVTTALVINEIMYHPIDNDNRKEYVEIYNVGPIAFDLTGYNLSDGLDYDFPPGTTVAAGGYIVVARDPALIRSIYGLSEGAVVGPETPEALADFGVLRNSGERLTLSDPLGRTVDTVRYYDGGEWPIWADGKGSSLELIDADQHNRVGAAWDASDDSSKATTEVFSYVGRHLGGEPELDVCLLDRGITVVDDISILGGGVTVVDTPIIEAGETWRYLKGTEEPPADWKTLGFNDSSWLSGPTGIGYGDNDDATTLTDMQNGYMTIFCRKTFDVADKNAIDELWLSVVIDDGYYAYLNGTQVGSSNVTGPAFDAPAPSGIEPTTVELDLTAQKSLLVNGTNVLAVQVHNAGLGSTDLSFIPRLVDRTRTTGGGTEQVVNGKFETNTAGWMIEGTHIRSGRTTQNPITGNASLKLIASGRGDNKVNRLETPEPNGSGLGNLAINEDLLISFKARWVVGSQTLLTNGYEHEMARSHQLAIPLDLGTPGADNSVTLRQVSKTGGNLGPVITDVSNDPVVPAGGETVKVRARVYDSDGIASVRLYYSLNNPSASPSTVNMQLVDENEYECAMPAQSQSTRVVFYITATDASGNVGRYPIDIRERSHPMLLNPPAASLNDLRYCIYRHDIKNPSTGFHSFRFYMTQADEDTLSSRKLLSNDYLSGSFLFNSDKIYYESKVRFSGSPWARAGWNGSFRVQMPKDNRLHGRTARFNLEDNQGNPLSAYTRISHYLLRVGQGSGGIPYTEGFTLVRWQLDDRVTLTREFNWTPDGDFIARWFPDDDEGDFLEMDDRFLINDGGTRANSYDGRVLYPPPSPRSDSNGANKENYRWFFGLRQKRGADEFANFIALAKVMDPAATSDALFDQQFPDYANVEEFLRIWAVEMNIDDWDTWGTSRGKNCYFYRPESDGRFHLFMWDVELTYGNVSTYLIPTSPASAFNPGSFSEVNRIFNRPLFKRMYYSILSEMTQGADRWFHSDRLSEYATKLAEIGMANTGVAQPGGYIDQRCATLSSRIQTVVYPQVRLAITTNSGNSFSTTQLTVNLAGTAPVDVSTILVNGDTFPVSFTSMTGWAANGIPLVPGANLISFNGFDFQGNLVDSDSITVTSTATWAKPAITELDPDAEVTGNDIVIRGTDFHNGVKVYFGAVQSSTVVYDEDGPNPGEITARVPSGTGSVSVTVKNLDNQVSNAASFTFLKAPSTFIRGDSTGDGVVDVSDGVKVLRHLFSGVTTNCEDAMDADDNEVLNVTDAIYVLDYLFRARPAPRGPFPEAGLDPSGTALGCDR